jgi:hypothetical protein
MLALPLDDIDFVDLMLKLARAPSALTPKNPKDQNR